MLIKLITSDFKGSRYSSNEDCPLARAVQRYFPNKSISVRGDCVRVVCVLYKFREHWDEMWSSSMVEQFIEQANEGEEVEYELEIPGLEP